MGIFENIRIALHAIRANWLRTVLTFLIIAFGIMALVGILTSIDSIKASLTENFASMGTNTFNIMRKGTGISGGRRGRSRKRGEKISFEQAMRFKAQYNYPAMVSVSALATVTGTVVHQQEKTNPNITVYGADENYFKVSGYAVEMGRNFSAQEVEGGRNVLILGSEVAQTLFINKQRALGKMVAIRGIGYKIIGVLEEKGSSMSFNGDRMVFIPLLNLRKYFGSQTASYNISAMVQSADNLDLAISEATGTFRQVRGTDPGKEADFEIQKSDGLVTLVLENTATIQVAAIFIGFITLLGAAIGLMNIMLVSVTERTREIGIRKSLGATRQNILIQFLTEAIVICQVGGVLGVILGILVGNVITIFVGGAFIVPWAWMALGVTLCFIVGLVSGLYPAMKAASLDPIESLRYE